MLRIQALRLFRREYFHALRNGLDADQASDRALTRIKEDILRELEAVPIVDAEPYLKHEKWGEILEVLIEWQILLRDTPIDRSKIPPKPPAESVRQSKEKDLVLLRKAIQEDLALPDTPTG